MWIGSLRLIVQTADRRFAGTDNLVQASVLREGTTTWTLALG
jgi:uncharacterized protein YheU (UPF0270 family)